MAINISETSPFTLPEPIFDQGELDRFKTFRTLFGDYLSLSSWNKIKAQTQFSVSDGPPTDHRCTKPVH